MTFDLDLAAILIYVWSALGITAGAHRLWAHRSYKARLPLRVLLALFNSMAFQVSKSVIQCQFVGWLVVGWLCLTSHRQRGHLETAPPYTVPFEGREAR